MILERVLLARCVKQGVSTAKQKSEPKFLTIMFANALTANLFDEPFA
jgi:hypothetical protein